METEYIEKQAAIDACCFNCYESNICGGTCDDTDRIRNIPPADVRPVVRGRWKDKQLGPWGMVYATCSACKKRVTLEQRHRNFCPSCGADMMGGDAE